MGRREKGGEGEGVGERPVHPEGELGLLQGDSSDDFPGSAL